MAIKKKKTATKTKRLATKQNQPYVILRCTQAGVHAGYLVSDDAKNGTVLRDARRIWYWNGAASISEIAVYGLNPAKSATSKICAVVAEHKFRYVDVCEVVACTDAGKNNLQGMPVWRA